MSTESVDDERSWAAEKRDSVADWRDGLADERDAAADAREQDADAREADDGQPEGEPQPHAADPGRPVDQAGVVADEDGIGRRQRAKERRMHAQSVRIKGTVARSRASRLRLADARPSLLALAFARIAEDLYDAESVDEVLLRIAECAVTSIVGCDMASITLSEEGGNLTAVYTEDRAAAADLAQSQAQEGPSLDAIAALMVYAPSFPDNRWPTLGPALIDVGVHSALAYHLAAHGPRTAHVSMNLYATTQSAFDNADRDIGLVLAANAPLAARAASARDNAHDDSSHDLRRALITRDVIGQAKGILMERFKVTPDDAFDVLRHASQTLNLKLHHVAEQLAETGEIPKSN